MANGGKVGLREIRFPSGHGVLKACEGDVGWRNGGRACRPPEWTPDRQLPISHTMGERVRLSVGVSGDAAEGVELGASGPLDFVRAEVPLGGGKVEMVSSRPLPRRIAKIDLGLSWSAAGKEVSPAASENVVYVTMGRPLEDLESSYQEDGVTLKRMERAMEWVEPLRTLKPHAIARALMAKFPFYSLRPSAKVPREYHHPTYFNNVGGAWPMSDHTGESGECQAIVRLVRGVLRQLGVPGEVRALLVWADPEVEGGRTPVSAYWEDSPGAGLSRVKRVGSQRWLATLVDSPVEAGRVYPASHTLDERGRPSPGFNRYEACLELTHDGVSRAYGGGAGEFRSREQVLRAFWGLLWVSEAPQDGFKVEEIVARYRQ